MPRRKQTVTLWHQFVEYAERKNFGFYEDGEGPMSEEHLARYIKYGPFINEVRKASKAPKLIIAEELMNALTVDVMTDSMKAMVDAKVLHLPYKQVMIEGNYLGLDDERVFIYCEEGDFQRTINGIDNTYQFRAQMWSILRNSNPRAVIHPFTIYVSFKNENGQPLISIAAPAAEWVQEEIKNDIPDIIKAAGETEGKAALRLLAVAFVVTNIRGVEREVIEASPKLNKNRQARGRPPIPRHTVLRIGHVYDQSGKRHDYNKLDGRSTKVYLRRGHTRNQRYGRNWEKTRLIYIEPVLVNFKGGDDMPNPTTVLKW